MKILDDIANEKLNLKMGWLSVKHSLPAAM